MVKSPSKWEGQRERQLGKGMLGEDTACAKVWLQAHAQWVPGRARGPCGRFGEMQMESSKNAARRPKYAGPVALGGLSFC